MRGMFDLVTTVLKIQNVSHLVPLIMVSSLQLVNHTWMLTAPKPVPVLKIISIQLNHQVSFGSQFQGIFFFLFFAEETAEKTVNFRSLNFIQWLNAHRMDVDSMKIALQAAQQVSVKPFNLTLVSKMLKVLNLVESHSLLKITSTVSKNKVWYL